jgi:hypothetical protein
VLGKPLREMTTWRYVASQLADAAAGVIDTAHLRWWWSDVLRC